MVVIGALLAACAAGCGGSASHTARPASSVVSPSLATSIETPAGSWAVVPMGHLDQPLNTFWQLFFRPRGASRWSDDAPALAVATNGGLVLATPEGRSLAVGVRPANLLVFSPLMLTSNSGRSWSPLPPITALAKQPDALAIGPEGQALALTTSASGSAVLESAAGLARWHDLTTAGELGASSAGRACGIVAMTAVGVATTSSLIGADCGRAGVVGIFSGAQGGWHLAGPSLPPSLDHERVSVLGLQPSSGGLCAILAVSGGQGTSLLAAWTTDGGSTWSTSPVLELGSKQVRSFGQDGGAGFFVLTSGTSGSDSIEVLRGPTTAWYGLSTPPAGTATLVFGPSRVDALVASDTVFTDWVLTSGSTTWTRSQVINVPIQFGSSS